MSDPGAALGGVVAEFSALHGGTLHDPWSARERCQEVSAAFVEQCVAAGVEATVISGREFGEVPEFPGVRLLLRGHFAVLVAADEASAVDGTAVYDWTGRQFDPGCEVPLVTTLGRWRERWTSSWA